MGGHSQETVVQVEQTATQNQDLTVGAKDLSKTIDNLVNVLLEQAKNPVSPTIIPVMLSADQQPAAQQDTQQLLAQQPYSNTETSSLLAMMYYNVLKGQQEVKDPQESPVNLITIFIVAAIVITAILIWRRR